MNRHDLELARWSEGHHGVFSVGDALRIGLSADQCAYRIRSGLWLPVHEGAYRLVGSELTPMGRLAAVSRVIRSDAGVSHRSAALVFDLPGSRNDIVEVSSPRRLRVQRTGVVAHESRKLRDVDLTIVNGIRVTTVARTILDLGAVCSSTVVEMAVDRALRRGLTSLAQLQQLLSEIGKRGRPGVAALRNAVDTRDPRQAPTESEMETRLRGVLRGHDLPDPVPQYVIRDGNRFVARVDFAYPEHRIAIEYDSLEHHVGTHAHIRDNARRLQIEALRWSVLVATVEDVRSGGDLLAAAVRARIDAASPRRSA
jgi:very-short-patch-repair endonuclease